MLPFNKDVQAFFALVRAGLWEQDVQLASFGQINFNEVYRLAEEQSVVGLVAAGIENAKDVKVPQEEALTIAGGALRLEQRNLAMNAFVAQLIEKLRKEDVYAILVKGQGIAQCYERPLWRASGDVDLLLSDANYEKAKRILTPIATDVEPEYSHRKHQEMMIGGWAVELHGTLHSRLSKRVDKIIDELQGDIFYSGNVRSWRNGNIQVFLPSANVDSVFVFSHILQHFYRGGIGLRQICDWCSLLWTYRESLDNRLLESRIRKAGLMSEWKAFGAFAVEYLGMPCEGMPFYSTESKWSRKAEMICTFILEVGNMGHNRDMSYYSKPYFSRKLCSLGRRLGDLIRHAKIFPLDSLRFFPSIMLYGLRSVSKRE